MSPTPRMRRALALALAGGSLAIGVPAALAAGGGNDPATTTRPAAPSFEQFIQQQQDRPDRGDCPERDGAGSGSAAPDGTAPDTGSTPSL